MKLKIVLLFAFLLGIFGAQAQVAEPVSWQRSVKTLEKGLYEVTFTAKIDAPWHMYDMGPYKDGPNATTFTFGKNSGIELIGPVAAVSKAKKAYDENFGMQIGYYAGSAAFVQKIKVISASSVKVTATVEWQVCDDQSCLPPTDYDFEVELEGVQGGIALLDSAAQSPTEIPAESPVAAAVTADDAQIASQEIVVNNSENAKKSLWAVIIEAILWGFAALLTPCVFPMVPMTVSFFMKGSGNKAKGRAMASFYGLSIVLLYTLPIAAIILITYFVGGDAVTADIFNWLATHWVPNVMFFLIFMIFAASFFGAFEIVMPSWLVNKSDSKADKGGFVGTFFMALTLVLVSFSCTGPIVGTILVKSTQGEIWEPIITMIAFSAAFALPFTMFAFFPSLLKNLPKSGGWLNSVKVVLGFIELALGLKFLSVADQTYHWGLLDREVYIALWVVIFFMMGLYLLGKLRFAHDSDEPFVSVKRLFMSILTFSFVVYLIPGMFGAPLKALSGYLPPIHTLDFNLTPTGGSAYTSDQPAITAKHADFLHLPHGLDGFFDYEEGVAYAKKVNKPVFLDFTGHGCVNCREMEANVWSDPKVIEILRRDYVIIALYVDDKKELPESQWVIGKNGKPLKTLGKINAQFQVEKFGINAQPYYVLLGKDQQMLVKPRGYDLSVNGFVAFLEEGTAKFKAQQ